MFIHMLMKGRLWKKIQALFSIMALAVCADRPTQQPTTRMDMYIASPADITAELEEQRRREWFGR